jgi:GH15 family glucan-1,4-alpha-glucosidase
MRRWTRRPRAGLAVLLVVAFVLAGSGVVALTRGWGASADADPVSAPPPPRPNAALAAGALLVAGGATGRTVSQSPAFQAWLAEGVTPSPDGPYAALATTALADLYSLMLSNGGVIASTPTLWHYVWPRDSSFAAAALAETGHIADAVRALQFLQAVQAPDGSFQARYLADGSGAPDARGIQEDGPGWALWAVDEVIAAAPVAQRAPIADQLHVLVQRSLQRLIDRTSGPGALPAPSSDYWEVAESSLTLGIAAPTLAGLLSGSRLVQATRPDEAALATRRATTLRASIEQDFGTSGYSRYAGGRGPDAAVTFTLPPYVDAPLSGAVDAAKNAATALRQPGGGVTPGSTWPRKDGVSWTPESALFLLASANTADRAGAEYWLGWFAQHSVVGTIPEKVDRLGRPGAVAPLAWSDALVLLALDQLDLIAPKP